MVTKPPDPPSKPQSRENEYVNESFQNSGAPVYRAQIVDSSYYKDTHKKDPPFLTAKSAVPRHDCEADLTKATLGVSGIGCLNTAQMAGARDEGIQEIKGSPKFQGIRGFLPTGAYRGPQNTAWESAAPEVLSTSI